MNTVNFFNDLLSREPCVEFGKQYTTATLLVQNAKGKMELTHTGFAMPSITSW